MNTREIEVEYRGLRYTGDVHHAASTGGAWEERYPEEIDVTLDLVPEIVGNEWLDLMLDEPDDLPGMAAYIEDAVWPPRMTLEILASRFTDRYEEEITAKAREEER